MIQSISPIPRVASELYSLSLAGQNGDVGNVPFPNVDTRCCLAPEFASYYLSKVRAVWEVLAAHILGPKGNLNGQWREWASDDELLAIRMQNTLNGQNPLAAPLLKLLGSSITIAGVSGFFVAILSFVAVLPCDKMGRLFSLSIRLVILGLLLTQTYVWLFNADVKRLREAEEERVKRFANTLQNSSVGEVLSQEESGKEALNVCIIVNSMSVYKAAPIIEKTP